MITKLGWKKIGIISASVVMMSFLAACSGANSEEPPSGSSNASNGTTAPESGEKITLRFLAAEPDRKSGQGLAEQTLLENYMKENPNIKIEVETTSGSISEKQRTYMATNEPIDITMVHGGADLYTLVKGNYVVELNPEEYQNDKYNFFPGVFKSFTVDGKLYGLPRNSDYEVIYYNKKMFADNGIKEPTTFNELLEAAKGFRAKGIAPMSTNGKDLWSFAEMYQDIVQRINGDHNVILDAVDNKISFKDDPSFLQAAELMKQLMDVKMFQDSYMTADYGTSQNLFTQGRAAMWYMGSWESSMGTNEKLSESFRNNLGVLRFPVVEGGKGKITDLLGWNGGGYALISASKHPEEAKKLFDYLMSADQWAKFVWETGTAVPAQKYDLTGKESDVQKIMTDILENATSIAGASFIDYGTSAFKDAACHVFGKFFAGSITPEQLVDELQEVAVKHKK